MNALFIPKIIDRLEHLFCLCSLQAPKLNISGAVNNERHNLAAVFALTIFSIQSISFLMGIVKPITYLTFCCSFTSYIIAWYCKNLRFLKIIVVTWTCGLSLLLCFVMKEQTFAFILPTLTIIQPIYSLIMTGSESIASVILVVNATLSMTYAKEVVKLALRNRNFYDLAKTVDFLFVFEMEYAFVILFVIFLFMRSRTNVLFKLSSQMEELEKLRRQLKTVNEEFARKHEKLQEGAQSKDDFLLSVSHDLKNPLNMIVGNLELCLVSNPNPEITEYLENSRISCEMLTFIINNLLDAAKIHNSNLEINPAPTNIHMFLEKMWSNLKVLIRRKNLQGEFFIDKDLPEILQTDQQRLMQLMYNLIGNSTKFTQEGFINIVVTWISDSCKIPTQALFLPSTVNRSMTCHSFHKPDGNLSKATVSAIQTESSANEIQEGSHQKATFYAMGDLIKSISDVNFAQRYERLDFRNCQFKFDDIRKKNLLNNADTSGYLKIEVIDSGCGMNSEVSEKLFQKFSRVVSSGDQKRLGMGMGLWISMNVCRAMGCNIKVAREENKGSTFTSVIKCSGSYKLRDATIPKEINKREQFRVLVVDDILTNSLLHKQFLNKCGIKIVETASNGQEAVDIFKKMGKYYFTSIFMDVEMPIMDGKAASIKIREYEKSMGWHPVKLIIITGNCSGKEYNEFCDKNKKIQADYLFSKPFTMGQCQSLVEKLKVDTVWS